MGYYNNILYSKHIISLVTFLANRFSKRERNCRGKDKNQIGLRNQLIRKMIPHTWQRKEMQK